ncbi:MAG: nickel pincer cofactor biosynthesis protein LarC [Acidobacteriota bacterium]|nr:nickel pincer cofactor biosynthesis protein LarC [Acidobacteriota bacterium]
MTRILHLDPLSGASGDMFLGLLLDLGVEAALFEELPERLGLSEVEVRCGRLARGAVDCGRVEVLVHGAHESPAGPRDAADPPRADPGHGRTMDEMMGALERANLSPRAGSLARRAVEALFVAESEVHGRDVDEIHLHEAGGDDALVDIAGTCAGIDHLGVTRVSCSVPIPLGGGTVDAAHGVLPVPAPAVALLLRGIQVRGGPTSRELVTPTGAALLVAVVDEFGPAPGMKLLAAGHGAGTYEEPGRANALRGLLGVASGEPVERTVSVLECTVDDMLPQDIPVLIERLLGEGARDACVEPVVMKKGRIGQRITVLCDPEHERATAERVLRESSSLGVRIRRERRLEWDRETVVVETPWGPVRVKRALDGDGRLVREQPEFEDCREAATRAGLTVEEVRAGVRRQLDGRDEPPGPVDS